MVFSEGGGGSGDCCGGPEPRDRPDRTTTTTTTTPYCGNGVINNGETCELPNTVNNVYCSQTTSDCQGNKTGSRDSYGNCTSSCGCVQDPFSYICVKDSCGATCAVNADCPNKCVSDVRYFNGACGANSCSCSFQTENCNGDGWVDTSDFSCDGSCRRCKNQEYRDYSCTPSGCISSVTDTREVCEYAPSGKHCVSGDFTNEGYCDSSSPYCGNACSVKTDRYECGTSHVCDKLDYTDISYCSADTACSGGSCSSSNSCGNGGSVCTDGCDRGTELLRCNAFGTCTNFWKFIDVTSCNPYTCSSGSCTSTCDRDCGAACDAGEQETRNVSCTTSQDCPGTKLQKRVCQAGSCQFGDWYDITSCQDVPGDFCPPVCGDGVVNNGEQCELPNTLNNAFCSQSIFNCLGNKTGSRDPFGNCNSRCACTSDLFSYTCVKDSCGAMCDDNSDCTDRCLDENILLTDGRCSGSSCSCSYDKQDCSKSSGWVDTGNTRVGPCPDDACKTCGQKEQEYRDYFCGNDECEFTTCCTRWVDVNRTVIKCPTGYFCVNGECEKKECKGDVNLEINLQICPKKYVRAHVTGLNLCVGKVVYLREESCDGKLLGTCRLNRNNECVRNLKFNDIGTPTIVACLDKNSDKDFLDSGEQDSVTVNVNCNNCEFTGCPLSVCTKCSHCGGYCHSYANQYGVSRCLNPGESCEYSCTLNECGAINCVGRDSFYVTRTVSTEQCNRVAY